MSESRVRISTNRKDSLASLKKAKASFRKLNSELRAMEKGNVFGRPTCRGYTKQDLRCLNMPVLPETKCYHHKSK